MHDFRKSFIDSSLRKVLKRLHFPLEVTITYVRWYVAYPLSLRHVEEMMQERGVFVDQRPLHNPLMFPQRTAIGKCKMVTTST